MPRLTLTAIAFAFSLSFLASHVMGKGPEPKRKNETTSMIFVGLDAYRMWDRWPYQRIGARA
jgi:hypothetical protein